jgi:hypothetical protein
MMKRLWNKAVLHKINLAGVASRHDAKEAEDGRNAAADFMPRVLSALNTRCLDPPARFR